MPLEAIKAPGRHSLVGGPFGSKLVSSDYQRDGVPVIRGANLASGTRFSYEDCVFVTEEKVTADLLGNLAFPGDIVVTQRGTLGQVGLIPDSSPYRRFVISQSQMKLTVDPSKADPLFVYYGLKSPIGQHEIQSRAITAGVPHINLSLFQQLRLPLPRLSVQRKIAAILSAYDDLIENNIRRIGVLEEMARRVYREWFVDFRYPGYENVPHVESELGLIPNGWRTGTLGDLVDINASTIRKAHSDEVIQYIDIASVSRGVVQEPKQMALADAPGRARRRVTGGDVLWSTVRPNLRAYALTLAPPDGCVASTGFVVLSPRAASFAYIYALTTADEFVAYLTGRATGAAYPAVTPSVFDSAPVAIPSPDILSAFAEVAEPLMRGASCAAEQARILRTTRDLLLPPLMAGEIDVEECKIFTAAVAA